MSSHHSHSCFHDFPWKYVSLVESYERWQTIEETIDEQLGDPIRPLSTLYNLLPSGAPNRWMPHRRSTMSSPSHCSAPCLGRPRWRVGWTSAGDGTILLNVWLQWRESRPTHFSLLVVSGATTHMQYFKKSRFSVWCSRAVSNLFCHWIDVIICMSSPPDYKLQQSPHMWEDTHRQT